VFLSVSHSMFVGKLHNLPDITKPAMIQGCIQKTNKYMLHMR